MDVNNDSDTSNSEVRGNYENQSHKDNTSKTCLQLNASGNSNDSCSEEIQTQSSESKYSQQKDLMNCIAFEKKTDNAKDELWNEVRYSDDFDSLSSDTTSDITDVSPQPPSPPPSSSGCSSIIKDDSARERKFNSERKNSLAKEQKSYQRGGSKPGHNSQNTEIIKSEEEEDEHSLTFLKDALHNLDCHSSVKSSFSSVRQHVFPQQKNLTFNKDQMRNINRENMILLRKIQSSRNRSKLDAYSRNYPRVSSSAINRQRQQRKIEFENSILLQKIQRVKGTTNTMIGFRRF